jgi:hypothetical protein
MTTMATTRLPQPAAVDCAVTNDPATRTLFMQLSERAGGYQKLLWREAHGALRRAEESGWGGNDSPVWAHAPGRDRIAYAVPGDLLSLKFHFPVGSGDAYGALVGKPQLYAIVTIDRESHRLLTVKFLHRGRP